MNNTYRIYNVCTHQYLHFDKGHLNPVQALIHTVLADEFKEAHLAAIEEGSVSELDFMLENPVPVHVGIFSIVCGNWTFSLEDCFS